MRRRTGIEVGQLAGEQLAVVDEWTVARSLVDEVDGYSKSVAGVDIEAVRTGAATGPNEVLAAQGGPFNFTSCSIGFPMTSRTVTPDDRVIAAAVVAAPPGSRWCDIDLRPGSLLVYAPATEHTAVNLPGLQFSFAITSLEQLTDNSDALGHHLVLPPRGTVHELPPGDRTRPLGSALPALADALSTATIGGAPPAANELMRALRTALSEERRAHRVGSGAGIDSRHVVHACVDYADAIRRIPSISELCIAARVSERRLRQAFVDEFGLPPTRYFRFWALALTHRQLLESDPDVHTVTEIAADVGFGHLGRFAGHYRRVYGESPSATLGRVVAGVS